MDELIKNAQFSLNFSETMQELLSAEIMDEGQAQLVRKYYNLKKNAKVTNLHYVIVSTFEKAVKGNVKALELIADLTGAKAQDRIKSMEAMVKFHTMMGENKLKAAKIDALKSEAGLEMIEGGNITKAVIVDDI